MPILNLIRGSSGPETIIWPYLGLCGSNRNSESAFLGCTQPTRSHLTAAASTRVYGSQVMRYKPPEQSNLRSFALMQQKLTGVDGAQIPNGPLGNHGTVTYPSFSCDPRGHKKRIAMRTDLSRKDLPHVPPLQPEWASCPGASRRRCLRRLVPSDVHKAVWRGNHA